MIYLPDNATRYQHMDGNMYKFEKENVFISYKEQRAMPSFFSQQAMPSLTCCTDSFKYKAKLQLYRSSDILANIIAHLSKFIYVYILLKENDK